MKKIVVVLIFSALLLPVGTGFADSNSGEELFKKHCALCHPNGGNIIKPEKTLLKSNLKEHGIKTPEDIVHIMRNPGKGMQKFTEEKIPNADAIKIADYILKTFQ